MPSVPSRLQRVAVVALAAEAALGLAWWIALLLRDDLGSVFLPPEVDPSLVRTFVVADAGFYVALPVAAAAGLARGRRWALPVLWLHAGGALYAALWGWGLVAVTGHGLLGAALMTPPAVVLPGLAARLSSGGEVGFLNSSRRPLGRTVADEKK